MSDRLAKVSIDDESSAGADVFTIPNADVHRVFCLSQEEAAQPA
jgi:hypothetical protein